MLVGIPKSATLTISNVSGDNITVQPFIDFGPEYSKFLNYSLELCEFEKCTPVTKTTKTDIYKDESKKLNLTITLTSDLPNNLPSVSINQGLQITGEVHTPKEDINIIPKIEEKETPLADTGVSSNLFTIMGIGGVLLMVGCGLFAAAKRKKTDPESNEEYKEN